MVSLNYAFAIGRNMCQVEDLKALCAQTLAAFVGLNGSMSNAAIPQAVLPSAEVSLERFRQSMDINVTGTVLCMKYQILAMIERGTKGSIVNTASADRKSTRLNSRSLMRISYAVCCWIKTQN